MRQRLLFPWWLLAAACTGAIGEPADDGHGPEVTVTGPRVMAEFPLDRGYYVSPPLVLDEPGTRVALMLTLAETGAPTPIEVRASNEGVPGAWRPLETIFQEEELSVARVDLDGPTSVVQIRVPADQAERIAVLTYSASTPDPATLGDPPSVDTTKSGLSADLAAAGILPRSAWGARPRRCFSTDRAKERMAIHHTASARTSRGAYEPLLRQTQAYHMDGRGYCDVGYHFFVTADGRVWEARDLSSVGGHSGNYNGGNIGIVLVGCFDSSAACNGLGGAEPPAAILDGTAHAVGVLARKFGIPIDGDRIKGHGQQPFQQTACPGDRMRAHLEEVRAMARGGAPNNPEPPVQPPQNPPDPAGCGALGVNGALGPNQSVTSCGGGYTFVHQGDGNVVLYNNFTGRAVWSTGTHGRATETLVMQGDGNLVLYGPGGALWHTGTHGNPGAHLAVQSDGNVVIYTAGGRPIFATHTVGR